MSHLEPNMEKEVLNKIEEVWEEFPSMRLGQLLENVVDEYIFFYLEDSKLISLLDKFKERFTYNDKSKK